MIKKQPAYKILIDTREQRPWSFGKSVITEVATIKVGDYTIQSIDDDYRFDNDVIIERKFTSAEFAKNTVGDDAPRFHRELDKLNNMSNAYVICDFTPDQLLGYPWKDDSIPNYIKKKIKIRGPYLMAIFLGLQEKYPNITFIMAGSAGPKIAELIFNRVFKDRGNSA